MYYSATSIQVTGVQVCKYKKKEKNNGKEKRRKIHRFKNFTITHLCPSVKIFFQFSIFHPTDIFPKRLLNCQEEK